MKFIKFLPVLALSLSCILSGDCHKLEKGPSLREGPTLKSSKRLESQGKREELPKSVKHEDHKSKDEDSNTSWQQI